MKRFSHQILDLAIEIKCKLLDSFVGVLTEVADKRLLADSARLDVARRSLAPAGPSRFGV
ncbi:hypothetical protein M8A51_21515 [Schlegelella sp. S2-27]|uniref:Uncharacterized protein n=1 Tax=Caldimonas mangrovi TaxID=2944811 RepID=A0ABT0YTN2_9BURK|nr:hypothetical protein [Caldimonas mangrovi]MCM5682116.1 hypothetical protein [Caldimonas mangrovi]